MIRSRIPPPPAPDPCPEPLRRILIKAMVPDPGGALPDRARVRGRSDMFRAGGPVRAAVEDLDATRRTHRAPDSVETDATRRTAGRPDEDDTRRTAADVKQPEAVDWPPTAAAEAQSGGRLHHARELSGCSCSAALYGIYAGVSSYLLYQHGQKLERAIQTETLTDPNDIWTQWTELSKGNPSSVCYGARESW